MSCNVIEIKRGDSLDLFWTVYDEKGPQDITGWDFASQLYKDDQKVADFQCGIEDAAKGLVRLRVLDTSTFPLGVLKFDVVMILPDPVGYTITSPTVSIQCVSRRTQL